MRRSTLDWREVTKLAMRALILVCVFWTEVVRTIPVDSKNMYETFLNVNSNLKSCSNYNVKHLETDRFRDLCSLPPPNIKDYAQDKAKIKEGLKFNLTPLLCYTIFHNVYAVCHPDTKISVNKSDKPTSSDQFCEVNHKISLPETCTHWIDDPEDTSKDDCFLVNEVVEAVLNNKDFCQNKCLVPDPDKTIPSSVNPLCIELLGTSEVLAQMAPKGQPSEDIKEKDPETNPPPGLAKPENKTITKGEDEIVADGTPAKTGENVHGKIIDGIEGNGSAKALNNVLETTAIVNAHKEAPKDELKAITKLSKVKNDHVDINTTKDIKVPDKIFETESPIESSIQTEFKANKSKNSKSKVNNKALESKLKTKNESVDTDANHNESKVNQDNENIDAHKDDPKVKSNSDKAHVDKDQVNTTSSSKINVKDGIVDTSENHSLVINNNLIDKSKVEDSVSGVKINVTDGDPDIYDKDIELKDKAYRNNTTFDEYNKTNSNSESYKEDKDEKYDMAADDVDFESSSSFTSGFGFDYDSSSTISPESDKDITEPVKEEKSNTEKISPNEKEQNFLKKKEKEKSDDGVDAEPLVAEEEDKAADKGDVKQEVQTTAILKNKEKDSLDNEEPKAEKEMIETKYENNMKSVPEIDEKSSFFGYFILLSIVAIIAYLVFHNKQKILALILEGRRRQGNRRRSGGREYRKLDSNLEDTMDPGKETSLRQVIY